jgi:hypothetical protein
MLRLQAACFGNYMYAAPVLVPELSNRHHYIEVSAGAPVIRTSPSLRQAGSNPSPSGRPRAIFGIEHTLLETVLLTFVYKVRTFM